MLNVIELEVAMKRTGVTKNELAKNLNISLQTLYNKFNGNVEFKPSEIMRTCEILKLSQKDRDVIFFTPNVDL